MVRAPCIYIMASCRNGMLYTCVTSNLSRRVRQRRESLVHGFTLRYRCKMLVFYECSERMGEAIALEKMALIEATNPLWRDLYGHLA